MKKISIYLLASGLIWLASGCDKRLELKNPQSIDATEAFTTDAKVKKVLVGNYATMGNAALFGGDAIWMSELMASNGELNWVGTFPEPRQIWGKTTLTNNRYVYSTYSGAYATIFTANNILANLGVVLAADRDRVKAEALFQRAMAYFELVKFYGEKPWFSGSATTLKGVPLITTAGPSAPQDPFYQAPRASVDDVYKQIILDLVAAEAGLPNSNNVYANKAAAALALSRVYLQQDKFAEARDAADRAITAAVAGGYSLEGNFEDAFNTNGTESSEDIFSIQITEQAGTNNCHTFFSTATYGARDGDIEVTDVHMNKYSAGDLRKDLFFFESGAWRTGKWRDVNKNVKVLRLAEAYLTRAECNQRLSTSVGAS
ncbi:MAG: RagB/SusD family nutrient uptake outer membrane protein, partial [Dinghuibacter sp.]|nr:RagB/SusD family nutrient uptake outer membrane protein [Dinghuibacter sp.]